jgi:hypothetical protein
MDKMKPTAAMEALQIARKLFPWRVFVKTRLYEAGFDNQGRLVFIEQKM